MCGYLRIHTIMQGCKEFVRFTVAGPTDPHFKEDSFKHFSVS